MGAGDRIVEAGPERYAWARLLADAGPRAGTEEAIPGPIERLLVVAPGR